MRDLLITMPRPAAELPARFPHPLAGHRPHAVAAEAASVLMRELEDGISARASAAAAEQEGKMFGVLVVRDHNGRIGFLAGFSGMLAGRWRVPGFVPPLFDLTARDGFWPRGQARLAELEAALTQLQTESAPLSHKLVELRERHADELAQLRAHHRERKRERARRRQALARDDPRHRELAHQSSGDRRERRQLRSSHAAAEARLVAELDALGEQITELRTQRSAESNRLLGLIHDLYRPADASGGAVDLRAAYAPGSPPGGAGDCAAPKLLGYGNRHGLEPIALAEFWWGPPPSTGGRHH
ncbi:MAG: RluA family pseudouridine synthase, partial [Deltaproteobacteria bacterium]|nr:RluA family pseudouridine synthase [Deltaproteobacteria bacterium]